MSTDRLETVYVTMQASGEMSLFDWERNLEELRAIIGHVVSTDEWDKIHVYGPDSQGFSYPSLAVRIRVTVADLNRFIAEVAKVDPWLPTVSFDVVEFTSRVEGGKYSEGAR